MSQVPIANTITTVMISGGLGHPINNQNPLVDTLQVQPPYAATFSVGKGITSVMLFGKFLDDSIKNALTAATSSDQHIVSQTNLFDLTGMQLNMIAYVALAHYTGAAGGFDVTFRLFKMEDNGVQSSLVVLTYPMPRASDSRYLWWDWYYFIMIGYYNLYYIGSNGQYAVTKEDTAGFPLEVRYIQAAGIPDSLPIVSGLSLSNIVKL